MSDKLCIQIDAILCGSVLTLDEKVESSFLQLGKTDDLVAISDVSIKGSVCKADSWLIIDARVEALFRLPCALCNELFPYTVEVPKWVCERAITEISGGSWDIREPLREAILVEVPFFTVCGGTKCNNFDSIKRFMRAEENENVQTPFKDLESLLR